MADKPVTEKPVAEKPKAQTATLEEEDIFEDFADQGIKLIQPSSP